jgi:hypothetical protein
MHIFEALLKQALEVQSSSLVKFPKLPIISPYTKVMLASINSAIVIQGAMYKSDEPEQVSLGKS